MRPWQLPSNGRERYTTRRVVFTQQFTLGKAPEVYPAGVYEVETKEQPLDMGGHTSHVRTSTVLTIPTGSGTYCREVRGDELDDAILRDADHAGQREPSENPDRGDTQGGRVL